MLLNTPEFKKMSQRDDKILAEGKIDWISKILPIADEILKYIDNLSEDDFPDYSDVISEAYECKDNSCGETNVFIESQKIRLVKAKQRLEDVVRNIANKDHNEAVESLANEIKSWENGDIAQIEKKSAEKIGKCNNYNESLPHQYPWRDVALSMFNYPECVEFDFDSCPCCGEKRIKLYFRSPAWTWAMMCGVGGEMVICPKCKIQGKLGGFVIRN